MRPGSAGRFRAKWFADHQDVTDYVTSYGLFIFNVGAKTCTLPDPSWFKGYDIAVASLSTNVGDTTISGTGFFLNGGNSYTQSPGDRILFSSEEVASGTWKWCPTASASITLTSEEVEDIVGAIVSGNTETGIAVTYDDAAGVLNFVVADEYLQDVASTMITGGTHTNLTATYHDDTGLLDLAVDSGLTAEQVQDSIAGMFTGNVETGIAITYDDAGNKINAAVAYGTTADTACEGDDARLLSAANHGAFSAALAAKATPLAADILVVQDTADANAAKKSTVAEVAATILGANPLGTAVAALAAKATPIDADSIILCDSADTNDAKETTIAELRTALLAADPLGTKMVGLTEKAIPVAADTVILVDSADTNDAKRATFTQVLAAFQATGAEVNTGTSEVKLCTPKSIEDSDYAKTAAIPVKASGAEINAGADDAKFVTAKAITDSELVALLNSANWQDWAPTFASVPAVDSTVARYQRIGQSVRGYIDIRGADGDAWTPSTCTLPVAPSDANARIAINARQKVNAAAATDMKGYIDAETDLRMEFEGAASCTDTQAWQIYIWFEYEVAAA